MAANPPSDPGFLRDFFYDPEEEGEVLPALLSQDEGAEPAAAPEPLVELLAFRLGAEDYAIELAEVQEILRLGELTEVPRAPKAILGVIGLRGETVPVLSLPRLLGTWRDGAEAAPPRSARVVILRSEQGPAGLRVDAVEQVVRLRQGSIETAPRGLEDPSAGAVLKGIGRWEGRLLAILDPVELLRPERRRAATSAASLPAPATSAGLLPGLPK